MRSRAIAVAAVVAGAVTTAAHQTPAPQTPTFATATTIVEVSAVVTRRGATVTDLRADEVVVRDNGVPQKLVAFEYVDLLNPAGSGAPVSTTAAPPTAVAPDVVTPSRGRDFVLVLDASDISPELMQQVMTLATALIDALSPEDRLAVITAGPHERVVQLSTDRRDARQVIEAFRGQKGSGAIDRDEREVRTLMVLRNLKAVAESMAGDASERRTMLLVSEGQPLGPISPRDPGDYQVVWEAYEQVVAAASVANVAIYAANPRGLEATAPVISTWRNSEAAFSAGMTMRSSADAMLTRYRGTLGSLTASTGGTLTVDTNNPAKGIPGMIRDSRQYYRLAYVQPDVPQDEKASVRTIDVSVSRRGVAVRARTAYLPR